MKIEVPRYTIDEYNKKRNKYCLCIPIINEGERITQELLRAQKYGIDKLVDIIICDGGSSDGSTDSEKLKKLGVNTLLVKKSKGKQGAQLRMGFSYSLNRGYDGIITIDGNNKDSIEDVPKFIKKLDEGYDFIQGSRFIKGGKAINTPAIRNIAVRAIHAPIISLTAGEKFTDTTNAYRAYSKKYLTHPDVQPFRNIFDTYELLAYLSTKASELGLKTCEVPVTREYPKKGKTPTKISPLKGNWNLFKILLLNMFHKYDVNKKNINLSSAYLFALQLACLFFILFNSEFIVTSFTDRIMGNGMLNNVDVSKRAITILFGVILIPLITYLLGKFNSYILQKTDKKINNLLKLSSLFGAITEVINFSNYCLNEKNPYSLDYSIIVLLIISIFTFIVQIYNIIGKRKIDLDNYIWSLVSPLPIVLLFLMINHVINISIVNNHIYFFCSLLYVIIIIFFICLSKKENIKKSYLLVMFAPIFESIYLELYNVLNQYNVILSHKYRIILILYLILSLMSFIIYFYNRKKTTNFDFKKWYYPLALISMFLIINQPLMVSSIGTDFFEQSNHGTAIYELLTYGSIPIIENFDAHMLYNEIGGVLFGLINNNTLYGIFTSYNVNGLISILLLYYLFKELFNRDKAFFYVLFFPLSIDKGLNLFVIAFFVLLSLINFCKKRTFGNAFVYIASLVISCLWRLDVGAAIIPSTLVVLLYFALKNKYSKKEIFYLVKSFLIIVGTCLLIYLLICYFKNINPINRILELISVANSNVNWGYASLGDTTRYAYIIVYYIFPILIISSLIYLFINRNKIDDKYLIILFVLGLFYIFNFQRGLIRHNLLENNIYFSLSLSLLYLAIFTYIVFKKNDIVFLFSYLLIIILSNLLLVDTRPIYKNYLNEAINSYTTFKAHDEYYTEKVNRLNLSSEMISEYSDLNKALNLILDVDETFIDLSNQTLLYALMGYKKPMYINQSPGLLSGDKSQEYFLDEVDKNIPIVIKAKGKLLSNELDDILNDYRYYKISEYVFNNYEPIAEVNGYEIWSIKDKTDKYLKELKKSDISNLKIITDYDEYDNKVFNLGQIPYIWGTYDNGYKLAKEKIKVQNNNVLDIDDEFDKSRGNYIVISIDSKDNTTSYMKLIFEDNEECTYSFNMEEGTNTYVIRVSTSYKWFTSKLKNVKIETSGEVSEISLSEGD